MSLRVWLSRDVGVASFILVSVCSGTLFGLTVGRSWSVFSVHRCLVSSAAFRIPSFSLVLTFFSSFLLLFGQGIAYFLASRPVEKVLLFFIF